MIANVLPSIFTIEIGGTPTLVFEACDGIPLWDGNAKLRAASPDESAMFAEAKNSGEPSDGLMLVYLVELDGEASD